LIKKTDEKKIKMEKVRFFNADRNFIFKGKNQLKLFIKNIFREEKKNLSYIHYIFCSDEYLLKINQTFLRHDYYTDVISFDLSEPKSSSIESEVYISLDRVEENAITNKTTQPTEILRVIFHAALHLCGFNDKKKSEILEMRKKEEYYLHLYLNQKTIK
jgi:rRNA maturation RNase YbeY